MRKEIPAPTIDDTPLTKVKQTFFNQPKKTAHKVVVIKKDNPIIDDDRVHFPTIEDLPKQKVKVNKKKVMFLAIEGFVGGFLTVFGMINSAGLSQIAAKYEGSLAQFLYIYQLGTVFIVIGLIVIYDTIKRVKV